MDDEIEQMAYQPAMDPFFFLLFSASLQRWVCQLKNRKYLTWTLGEWRLIQENHTVELL